MITMVQFNTDEKGVFLVMQGMINNTLLRHLDNVQVESLSKSELKEFECCLETLKNDTHKCLLLVDEAIETLERNKNGKDR